MPKAKISKTDIDIFNTFFWDSKVIAQYQHARILMKTSELMFIGEKEAKLYFAWLNLWQEKEILTSNLV